MTGQHAAGQPAADELACAYCGTELEHGMDTIIRIPEHPGLVFCDRCERLARLNADTDAPTTPHEHTAYQVGIAVGFVVAGIVFAAVILLVTH